MNFCFPYYPAVTSRSLAAVFMIAALSTSTLLAEDPSIDRLLSKLPPPEKLAKPVVQHALQQSDPALNDPLAREAIAAFQARNFSRALGSSRRFARKYPRNAVAQSVHGVIALSLRQLNEASVAFRAAISVQPNFAFGYFGLGAAEAEQGHYGSALQNFRELTRLEPKVAIGWLASSSCAERLGRREESLAYAKRATTLAPNSAEAWLQVARVEKTLGHWENAKRAAARAQQLGATAARSTSTRPRR